MMEQTTAANVMQTTTINVAPDGISNLPRCALFQFGTGHTAARTLPHPHEFANVAPHVAN